MSLKPAFTAGPWLKTRSMLHSEESKVFFITVSSKRQKKKKKQCQDQFVNKSGSHPLCYFFFFFGLVFMDEDIKSCMILLLWDTNIFSLGLCSSFPRF